jgi:hypothetical protein
MQVIWMKVREVIQCKGGVKCSDMDEIRSNEMQRGGEMQVI